MSHADYWRQYAEKLEDIIATKLVPAFDKGTKVNLGELPTGVLMKVQAEKQKKIAVLLKGT